MQRHAPRCTTEVRPHGPGHLIYLKTPALQVGVSTLGATLHSVKVRCPPQQPQQSSKKDAAGECWTEVNLHYDDYDEAVADCATYIGATVGRFAGRISNARFVLDGQTYTTPANAGKHTIHSGGDAFDKKQWSYMLLQRVGLIGVRLTYVSPHGENGFPATLHCAVTYFIKTSSPNALHTTFDAYIPDDSPADATVVNMFNHAYWNLNGVPSPQPRGGDGAAAMPATVHNHILHMPRCNNVVDTDSSAVPTGALVPVCGALDLRRSVALGDGMADEAALRRSPCGYDHPFYINGWHPSTKRELLNAEVTSPTTHITMRVYSTFPCIWVYTANNLKADARGVRGERFARYTGVALEPQHMPDAVNQPSFPQSVVVRKGASYHERMTNEFIVDGATTTAATTAATRGSASALRTRTAKL